MTAAMWTQVDVLQDSLQHMLLPVSMAGNLLHGPALIHAVCKRIHNAHLCFALQARSGAAEARSRAQWSGGRSERAS